MPPAPVLARVEGFPREAGEPLDLEVLSGDVILLRGPNGSGKTSLLRALAGLASAVVPASVRSAPAQLLTQHPRDGLVGLTVQGEFRLRRTPVAPMVASLGEREGATLSSGEARLVALGVASSGKPSLLLLDEPAEGLDEEALDRLAGEVREVAARGGAVVAADHSGALASLSTRTVRLAPEVEFRLQSIPHEQRTEADQPPVTVAARGVSAPACEVRRGRTTLRLPALRLDAGFHLLVGPNGSGKTTLLSRLAGLAASQGVLVAGSPPRPGVSTRLHLALARDLFLSSTVAAELQDCSGAALRLVPDALYGRHPLTLSGGEAQRVALAKTLGRAAPLYLLDEPDAHLDAAAWPLLRDALAQRVAEGACVLAATHDHRLRDLAHSAIVLGFPPSASVEPQRQIAALDEAHGPSTLQSAGGR